MIDPVPPLVLDLLEWIGREPRTYAEVIEVWRTSCPRLPVWEEANARGFVERRHEAGREARVEVSPTGAAFLRAQRAVDRAPLQRVTIAATEARRGPGPMRTARREERSRP